MATITVTSPTSTTVLYPGDTHTITWSTTGISSSTNMTIQLRKDGTSYGSNIVNQTPNDGSYSWTIPSNQVNDQNYQIRIFRYGNYDPLDDSDEFQIGIKKTPSESISLADSYTKSERVFKNEQSPSDAVSLGDSYTKAERVFKKSEQPSDAVSLGDSYTTAERVFKKFEQPADETTLADSHTAVERVWNKVEPADDTISLADSYVATVRIWAHRINVDESVSLEDGSPVAQDINEIINILDGYSVIHGGEGHIYLWESDSATEQVAFSRKTGWIPVSELSRQNMIRRLNMDYISTDPIDIKVYTDWDENSPVYEHTLPAATSTESEHKSLRVGRRAKHLMIEMTCDASTAANTKIDKLEVQLDA